LNAAELRTRVPLTLVQSADTVWHEHTVTIPTAGVGGVRIVPNHEGLIAQGQDSAGQPWTFAMPFFTHGTSVWRADLDGDGIEDVMAVGHTGGNGWSPRTVVMVLMFEPSGRPVPWTVKGYFEEDGRGLKDLLDLDGDGHAELTRMSYDDGYWITSLFEAGAGRWRQVRGAHGGRSFPLHTRFTHRPNRKAVTPAPGRAPIEDQLGNVE
jgi:hypothetical protein